MKLVSLIKVCLNETYSKVHKDKQLSDSFPIQNCPKQGDALSPLLFNFALEYGTHQLLAYVNVNLLGDNIDTVNKNTKTLIDVNK
jgi:hypothetical protein